VPGDATQVVWVWLDALVNYLATLGYPSNELQSRRFWTQADRRVHVVGKGIARFHAVVWPALLLSAGLPLPTTIWVHGYVTVFGQKIGKSRGNAVDPTALVERYGIDALRYFLLRHVGPKQDGDVDDTRLAQAYRSELADGLGNLLARTVALLRSGAEARVPPPPAQGLDPPGELLAVRAERLAREVDDAVERFAPDDALRAIWVVVAAANKHLADTAPWALARQVDSGERVRAILHHTAFALAAVGRALVPFLPTTANAIAEALAAPGRGLPLLFPKKDVGLLPPQRSP
jgi:methionyl-tRNA synthetase